MSFQTFKANYYSMKASILILCFVSLSLFAACTPVTATHGSLLEDYQLKEVLPGIDGKDDVVRKIGSPTVVAPFNENAWYYMGQKTEKKGILDPKVVKQRVIVVSFDSDGKVGSVKERRDPQDTIPIVQRITPVSGNELTFLQQMIGNVGKFNTPKGSAADTADGGMNR